LDEEIELLYGVVVLLRTIESHRLLPYLHHYLVVFYSRYCHRGVYDTSGPPGRSHQQVFSSNSSSSSILVVVVLLLLLLSFLLDVVFNGLFLNNFSTVYLDLLDIFIEIFLLVKKERKADMR